MRRLLLGLCMTISFQAAAKLVQADLEKTENDAIAFKSAMNGFQNNGVQFSEVQEALDALKKDGVRGLPQITAQNAKSFKVASCSTFLYVQGIKNIDGMRHTTVIDLKGKTASDLANELSDLCKQWDTPIQSIVPGTSESLK